MTDSAARPPDYTDTCPVCGTPVRVVGHTTKSYESAYQALLAQCEQLAAALESIRKYSDDVSWTAEQALTAYRAWRKEGGE